MRINGTESTGYILKEIGSRLKDARIALPMTREELAEKSGVSLSTIVRMESGMNTGTEQLVNVLRVLKLLHNTDMVVPEYRLSPVDMANGKSKRKRASSAKPKKSGEWKWGDEI